ncbi:MAG: sugar phosphate isomerase/epimerase family protein [Butyricicoccus sp.]
MKLGFNEATCMRSSTVEVDLTLCEENGYDYIELRLEMLQDYLTRHGLDELKEYFDTHHLKPYAINSIDDINFRTPEEWAQLVENFTFVCEVSEVIGNPYIVLVPTIDQELATTKLESEILEESVRNLKELAEIASAYGVKLAFEPIGDRYSICNSLRLAHEIINEVNREDVGLSVDCINLYMHDKCSDVGYIEKIPGEKIFLFHICDCEDLPLGTLNHSNRLMPGDGCIPIREIIDALRGTGFDTIASVELFREEYWSMPPAEVIEMAADKTRQFL